MAKMTFTSGGGGNFTPHPTGTFEGVIEEVLLMEESTFTDSKTGEQTVSFPRQFVIRNTDGKAKYEYEDRDTKETVTGNCTVKSRPLYFYSNGEGGFYKPGPKSNLYQYYQAVMGEIPDFEDFDDECVLGTRIMYSVLHVDAEDKDNPDKVYANLASVPMRHPDQSGNYDVITQAQRAEQAQEGEYQPEEGSVGEAETLKQQCTSWIDHAFGKGVWTKTQADSYLTFLSGPRATTEEMKRFLKKAETDCEAAGIAHPDSTGGDDLPF